MKRFFALLILILTLFSFTAITSFASETPDFHFNRTELNKCISDSGLTLEEYDVVNSKFWGYKPYMYSDNLYFYYTDNDFKIEHYNSTNGNYVKKSDGSDGGLLIFSLKNGKLESCRLSNNGAFLPYNDSNSKGFISPFDYEKHFATPDMKLGCSIISNAEKYINLSAQLFDVIPQNAFTDFLLRLKPLILPAFIAIIGFLSFRKAWSFISSAVKGA